MKITLVPLYVAATCFQKKKGSTLQSDKITRGPPFPLLGLIPLAPLPSLTTLGRFQPFEGTPIFPSISKQIGKWVSPYRVHASVAGSLWKRNQTHHACVKTEIRICFLSSSSDNVHMERILLATACQLYFIVDFSSATIQE